MLSSETVNKFETPSNKQNLIPKCNTTQNQKHLQIFCKDLSKINIPDECGWTPLYRTVIAGDIFSTSLLLNNGADPNIQCTMGETPLFQAVDMEKMDHVKLLLKNGANPNIANDDGLTPLHISVIKQNIPIVKILLKYNANPNIKSKLYEQTPLHLAIKNNTDPMILLLLVQFNGSLINEDKFKKKPIDYTNSKEMQSTIEKLKFDQQNSSKIKEIHNFQTPRKNFAFTPSNVYSNTIRSKSKNKDIIIEGNNAILQNPGNLKYNIINGKNTVSSNKNAKIETVKKDLFNSSEQSKNNYLRDNDNIIIDNNNNFNYNNYSINNDDNKENKDNINININKENINKKIKIMKFLEDKENINPNNIISFSLNHSKTGKFGTIMEENSLIESRQNNNSLKPKISKKNSNESGSSEKDKNNQAKEISFSFSTNTFNNNKIKTNLSQSIKQEDDNNNDSENNNDNENNNTNNIVKNESININEENTNNNNNNNYDRKKKIIIKSYKKEDIYNSSSKKKNINNDDYLYEKIIKKTITKIEIYDENNINTANNDNETINQIIKRELNEEEDSKRKSIRKSNKSLYNKPIIKNKFNYVKNTKKINMRPSIEVHLKKNSSNILDNSFPKRSTFSGKMKQCLAKNLSFHQPRLATTGQIKPINPINPENKNIKFKKNLKASSISGASLTTMGASGNELNNQNQNSLWKFLNDIITNEKSLYNSFLTNNINSDRDNDYFEVNYKYPIYEWLKEINLHCYYSLFKEKKIYSMDKVINNLKTGNFNISKHDIEKIGILIPGHIYRIITKLEIDSCKIKEKICDYLIKNKKRIEGKNINITNNSVYYCCGCCSTNEQIHNFNKIKNIFNLEQWLIKIKKIKYRDNFIENGFDLFEYFILQMFSTIPIDDYIIKEELKIENDKDRDIILLRLNKDVKYIIQKADDILCYNNSYEIGEQRNFEENNVYEFETQQEEKNSECIII